MQLVAAEPEIQKPLNLNFDSETMPEWFGLPKKEELPAVFQIDYLRAWKKAAEKKPAP